MSISDNSPSNTAGIASNASRAYTNIEGLALGACQLCGFCDRNGCEANAKAGPHVCILPKLREDAKFELRTRSWVSRLLYDKAAKKVQGVVYVDMRNGEEYEQPAGIVALYSGVTASTRSAFATSSRTSETTSGAPAPSRSSL